MKKIITSLCFAALIALQPATGNAAVSVPSNIEEKTADAVKEFKSLSKAEKKSRIKEVKQAVKKYRKDVKSGKMQVDDNTILLAILAILLPPLAVYLHQGEVNNKFWISLVLTLLGWLPGVIYALVVILGAA